MAAIAGQSRDHQVGGASSSVSRLEELGIVGAGGGGFPTAVKFSARVSLLIVNAAECEPLLHKDKELLYHHSEPFLRGLQMAMEIVGAREGAIGIKEKYHEIIAALESPSRPECGLFPCRMSTRRAMNSFSFTWSLAALFRPVACPRMWT